MGQKAPSAKRCIKTAGSSVRRSTRRRVRKHRAPKGALRPDLPVPVDPLKSSVRKHRAPKGALRPRRAPARRRPCHPVRKHRAPKGALRLSTLLKTRARRSASQKAPSAKRCIKTPEPSQPTGPHRSVGQKAPSAKRCIKTLNELRVQDLQTSTVRKHRAPKGALRP